MASRAENLSLPRAAAAERHRQIAEAYQRGGTSRAVAAQFGVSGQLVRYVAKIYGVARPVGRPRK